VFIYIFQSNVHIILIDYIYCTDIRACQVYVKINHITSHDTNHVTLLRRPDICRAHHMDNVDSEPPGSSYLGRAVCCLHSFDLQMQAIFGKRLRRGKKIVEPGNWSMQNLIVMAYIHYMPSFIFHHLRTNNFYQFENLFQSRSQAWGLYLYAPASWSDLTKSVIDASSDRNLRPRMFTV